MRSKNKIRGLSEIALWGLLLLGAGAVSGRADAAIAYVQGTYQAPTSSGLVTATYAAAQGAGDLNVVVVGWSDSVSTVSSVTDSKGNTYVAAVGPTTSSGNASQRIYYAKNISSASAGSNSVTVTFSSTVSYPVVDILEYNGIDTTNSFDVGVGASGSGTALNSGSVTTTNANDLLVAGNYIYDVTTATGTGYTQRILTSGGDLVEDKVVATTGSYSATSTQGASGWWVMQLASFRAASTGGDTTAPTPPTGLGATVASATAINLSWTASTDNVAVTGYRVERCSGASCTTYAQIGTPTTTTYSDTGLTASTSYSYRVRATDAAGNLSTYSSTASGTTSAAGDTTAPTAPTGLGATVASATVINLSWTASTDNVGVTGYRVESCSGASCTTFAQIGTPTTTTYSATSLTASTSYNFRVRATDAAGNLSSYSSTVAATTSAAADTTAPTAPTGLSATVASATAINLSWTASTDNVAVTGYRVERCSGASCTTFAQIGTPTTTTYSDAGLTASTSYSYRVRATDAAGNLSTYSGTASAATSASTSIAYVQGAYQGPGSSGLVTATYAAAQSAGDLNVVVVGWSDSVATVSSVTDSKGNTYLTAVGPTTSAGNATQRIYYAKNISSATAGSNTVTVTFSTTVAYPIVEILEYSGADTTNPLDVAIGASGSGTTQNSGSVTTTNANDLLLGGNYISDVTTAVGAGYTQRILTSGGDLVEDKIVSAAGSYSATSTQGVSGWWVMQLAAFRAASSGGDTTAPTAPTGLGATVASATAINLNWTASTDNVAVTGYRVERCSGASCTTFAQIGTPTTTTYSDTGLTASTSYSYRVRATDAAGNLSTYSSTTSGTTSATGDATAPTAPTGLGATVASASVINLSWTASTDNLGVTGYRVESCSGASCTTFAQIGTPTATSYSVTGLTASTAYSFRVRATDAAGNLSTYSSTASATTAAASDTTAPTAPTGLGVVVVSATAISLSWTASTDNVAVTGYRVERCSGASCTTFAQVGTPTATNHSDTGLTASTNYSYRVLATDAAGNLSTYSTTASGTTSAAGDTTAPTAPTSLTATVASSSGINLSWTASTDNVAVTGYRVESCSGASCATFAQIGAATTTTYGVAGLTASTSYSFQVRATDAAGNLSAYSSTATATTQANVDTTPPSSPTGLSASVMSSSQIMLSWNASTDNIGVAGYSVERCQGAGCSTFTQVGAPVGTSYGDVGLIASTSYSYRVRASDGAGNSSGYSNTTSATTITGANSYTYDANGHLSSITTSTGTAHYYYDAAGNVTSIAWTVP